MQADQILEVEKSIPIHSSKIAATSVLPVSHSGTGYCEIHPAAIAWLTGLGLCDSADFLRLPGEIIGGHISRNVARVRLPSPTGERVAYLKREHSISWRDRLKHAFDGYGFTSKSERELRVLRQLQSTNLTAPEWLAWGTDGNGRAFLLIEESVGYIPLNRLLEREVESAVRREFADSLGELLADYHAAGFTQPDLLAKHVLVNERTLQIAVIDWQRTKRRKSFDIKSSFRALAQLHASLNDTMTWRALQYRCLQTYLMILKDRGISMPSLRQSAERIGRLATRLRRSRGILQGRRSSSNLPEQKLHWIDGEAICAVSTVAERLDVERVRNLFYPPVEQRDTLTILAGSEARILRESKQFWLPSFMLSEKHRRDLLPMKVARLAFHLERLQLPAPRLIAFGIQTPAPKVRRSFVALEHREGKAIPFSIWWDSIRRHEEPQARWKLIREFAELVRQMHEAGCVVANPGEFGEPFSPSLADGIWSIRIAEIERLKYVRLVDERDAWENLARIHRAWCLQVGMTDALRFLRAYYGRKLPKSARYGFRRSVRSLKR